MAIEQLSIVKETVPTFRIPIQFKGSTIKGDHSSKVFVNLVLFFSSAPTQNNQSKNLFQKKETPINEMQRFILENKNFLLFFVNIKIKIRRLAKNAAFISQYSLHRLVVNQCQSPTA